MSSIQEVFLETDWDDAAQARQKRDERILDLQATGLVCVGTDLYNIVNGRRVFVLAASSPPPLDPIRDENSKPRSLRPQRRDPSEPRKMNHPLPQYEVR